MKHVAHMSSFFDTVGVFLRRQFPQVMQPAKKSQNIISVSNELQALQRGASQPLVLSQGLTGSSFHVPTIAQECVLGHSCTLPTESYLGVPSLIARLGKSTSIPWTRCHPLEPGCGAWERELAW
jgi:hypothetical protein